MTGTGPPTRITRVYDDPGRRPDEYRVLVDRLWPRGRSAEQVDFDEWAKDLAPSSGLRRWYGHDPDRFDEFARRYRAELDEPPAAAAMARLAGAAAGRPLVLMTATRDVARSGAAVLEQELRTLFSAEH